MTEPEPSAARPAAPVRVGLLGCGNVGAALVGLVETRREAIAARSGVDLEITRVAVRSLTRDRGVKLADGVLTTDAAAVVADPEVDVVVEVIGGIEPARELILDAIAAGKPVITANKELLANHGAELAAAADEKGVDLLFEAAVAGGIPIIRPLRESLAGEDVTRVMGIVNGTTNFILTRMSEDGTSYATALADAQELGYAERDPTADVEGYDAAQMLAIGLEAVGGDLAKKAEFSAALQKATIDSPRGSFTISKSHNPVQDIYLRKVEGNENKVAGVAIEALADPGRGCRM